MINADRRVLVLSLVRAAEMFGVSFLIVVLPLFIASDRIHADGLLGLSVLGFPVSEELLIGIAISAAILVSSAGQPLAGRLTDKTGNRTRYIILGLALLAITLPFYLVIESYWGVLLLRAFQGVAGALTIPTAIALVNEYSFADGNHGENLGFYNTFRLAGFGLGPMVAGAIISKGPYSLIDYTINGIDAAFYGAVFFALLSLGLVLLYIEDPDRDKSTHTQSDQSLRDVLNSPAFTTVLVFAFATFWLAASINVFSTLENQINARFDQTATWFGIQFSAAILANVLGQIPIGRAADRYRKKPFIVIGFLILIPSITIQGFAGSAVQMAFYRTIQGISVALVFVPTLAFVGELAGNERSGLFLSVVSSAFALGLAIGPLISGALYTLGGFSLPFVVSGVFSVLGLALVVRFIPTDI